MIKFFRKIRYDLMEKNKTKKYLSYAFGEIVLVVIGILIALSINNWNQKRILKNDADTILFNIKYDLIQDMKFFNKISDLLSERGRIIDLGAKRNFENDTLLVKIGNLITVNYDSREFQKSMITLTNSGNINLIDDQKLIARIQDYYTNLCDRYNNHADYQKEFNIQNIEGPLLHKLVLEPSGKNSVASLRKEIDSGNLISIINWQNLFYKNLNVIVQDCINEASEIQLLIGEYEKTKG